MDNERKEALGPGMLAQAPSLFEFGKGGGLAILGCHGEKYFCA